MARSFLPEPCLRARPVGHAPLPEPPAILPSRQRPSWASATTFAVLARLRLSARTESFLSEARAEHDVIGTPQIPTAAFLSSRRPCAPRHGPGARCPGPRRPGQHGCGALRRRADGRRMHVGRLRPNSASPAQRRSAVLHRIREFHGGLPCPPCGDRPARPAGTYRSNCPERLCRQPAGRLARPGRQRRQQAEDHGRPCRRAFHAAPVPVPEVIFVRDAIPYHHWWRTTFAATIAIGSPVGAAEPPPGGASPARSAEP